MSLAFLHYPSELPKPAWTSVRASVTAHNERGRGRPERIETVAEEIAFLAEHDVPPALLEVATKAATAAGVSAEQALFGEGLMREEEFYRLLARRLGAPRRCGGSAVGTPGMSPRTLIWASDSRVLAAGPPHWIPTHSKRLR